MANKNRLTHTFTIGGVVLGLILTFFIIKGVLDYQNQTMTFSNIKALHRYSIFFLVDLLPVILGLFARFCGLFFEGRINLLSEQLHVLNQRSAKLQTFAEDILQGKIDSDYDTKLFTDKLGQTLVNIVENIKSNKDAEEQRKKRILREIGLLKD